jgi:hypothetical protein
MQGMLMDIGVAGAGSDPNLERIPIPPNRNAL